MVTYACLSNTLLLTGMSLRELTTLANALTIITVLVSVRLPYALYICT